MHTRIRPVRSTCRRLTSIPRGELELCDGGIDAVIVVSYPSKIGGPEWPDETATVMRFREGTVTSMKDYLTKAEAPAAVGKQL